MKVCNELKKNGSGLVFNVQKFSVHDGPGIRTIVFFKGCPLRCQWCSNPESLYGQPELAYNKNNCIGTLQCGLCLQACRYGVIEDEEQKVGVNRELCMNCGACTKVCPSKALEVLGKYMHVNDVLKIVEEDSVFYSRSGGGLTLSGGEPLLQPEFACELLEKAKNRGLDTAIETSGYAQWQNIEKICQHIDTVFYDIKCIDSDKHKSFTNVSNERILHNFQKLCRSYPEIPVIVRTPVIPGFNDTKEDILAIINFIRGIPNVKYELMPYHRFGEAKYGYLGKNYPLMGVQSPTKEQMESLQSIVNANLFS